MSEKILITSALPYANGPLHFGHIAGAFLPADAYARYQRAKGSDVLYVCGSDEYGVAITLSAEMAKRKPKEHVDIFHKLNQELFSKLHFTFDHYSRTTIPVHTETAQEFFLELFNNGYIDEKTEKHLYSEKEDAFLADRYVMGICPKCGFEEARGDECQKCGASYESTDLKNPVSKVTGSPLVLKPSKHWYLRFDKFKEPLKEWIGKKDWKPNVLSFAQHYIDDLKPRCITRDSSWGIPVPLKGAEGKVLYVWFDAPIGYISITKELSIEKNDPDLWKRYWQDPDTKLVHFIGKDNIPFHAVFFPAMLMGQNEFYKLPDEIPANEFFLLEGRQFSKSDRWYVDFLTFLDRYSSDQIRYALAANAPETSDSEFKWKDFQIRCNTDLLGKFGNFINRTLTFVNKYAEGKVPPLGALDAIDQKFIHNMEAIVQEGDDCYKKFHLRKASNKFMELAHLANQYFDEKKPWVLRKDPAQRLVLETTLALCLECIKNLCLIASPIIPDSVQKTWEMLGFSTSLEKLKWEDVTGNKLPAGQKINEPVLLFRKIEDEEIAAELEKLGRG